MTFLQPENPSHEREQGWFGWFAFPESRSDIAAVLELASLEPDSLEESFVEDDFASALQTLCEGIFPCWGSHPLSHCIEVRHLRI